MCCSWCAFTKCCENQTLDSSCPSVRPSVHPNGITRLQMGGFLWNLIQGTSNILCRQSSNFIMPRDVDHLAARTLPGVHQLEVDLHDDALVKEGAKITQTQIRLPFYESTFKTVVSKCVHTWTGDKVIPKYIEEITKIPDWPRRKAVVEFRLCVGHDCLGAHLHRTGIRPDPYCMLCSLRESMGIHPLGQCTGQSVSDTGRSRQKWWKNWFASFLLLFFVTPAYC